MPAHGVSVKEYHNHTELMVVLGLPFEVVGSLINSLGLRICDGERLNDSHFCLCSIANRYFAGISVYGRKERVGDF